MDFPHLNESAINSDYCVFPKYSPEEYVEIVTILTNNLYDSSFFRDLIKKLKKGNEKEKEKAIVNFEQSIKTSFAPIVKDILFISYEDLPLLINCLKNDLIKDLYCWRLKIGK